MIAHPAISVRPQQVSAIRRSIVAAPRKPIAQSVKTASAAPITPPPQEDPNMYRDALKMRGVTLNGEPRDPRLYKLTNDVFDNVYKGQPINLHLNFKQGAFDCGQDKNSAGCYHWDADKNLDIRDDLNDQFYKFALLHEYAHSTGVKDEKQADQFAQKYVPVDGWYNKIGKPLENGATINIK